MKPETLKMILDALDRKGCTLISAHQLQHPGDHYLQVVLVKRDDSHSPYVTWTHNSECGGFHHGHYISTYAEAQADFADRIKGK